MDGQPLPISSTELYGHLGNAAAAVDVRRDGAFGSEDGVIVGALHRSPWVVERWRSELTAARPVVASQSAAEIEAPNALGRATKERGR